MELIFLRKLPIAIARVSAFMLVLCLAFGQAFAESKRVELLRTPNDGIQPQAAVDPKGVLHLIYYKGDPRAGNVFYVREEPGKTGFSDPIQVNRRPGSAIAMGTIRGAQIAIGKNGRVHVAWNGAQNAEPGSHIGAPMLYTRMNDAGTGFEPERDLITYAAGLDGGGSVAADPLGNVYVVWHAHQPGGPEGEAGRAVFVARSTDEGKTFAREAQANPKATGVCACCGLRALADSHGSVYVLYRAASEKIKRDEILLVSRKNGENFEVATNHPWIIATCPMSSASFAETQTGTLGAWETDNQVYFARVNPKTFKVSTPIAAPGSGKRKHPIVAGNAKGETLLAWTEGTGWQKGGTFAWQLFDREGKLLTEKGSGGPVKVWSLVAAYAKPNGDFVVIY